jgi:di/tricarboxylate transporter
MEVGGEQRLRLSEERKPWAVRSTSLICLVLLALLTFVQVVHFHPAATDADHCPICVAMHSTVPVTVLVVAVVFARISEPVPVPVAHSVVRPWHCTLFNRPPPTKA